MRKSVRKAKINATKKVDQAQDTALLEEELAEALSETEEIDAEELAERTEKEIDWKDMYARMAADFENYRKRNAIEYEDARCRERDRVMEAWLDVYDNALRALNGDKEAAGPWYEGFASLKKQMDAILKRFEIVPIKCEGEEFNPELHEAIATLPNPEMENNAIMHVERAGFRYKNGRPLRVARVVVVKNK